MCTQPRCVAYRRGAHNEFATKLSHLAATKSVEIGLMQATSAALPYSLSPSTDHKSICCNRSNLYSRSYQVVATEHMQRRPICKVSQTLTTHQHWAVTFSSQPPLALGQGRLGSRRHRHIHQHWTMTRFGQPASSSSRQLWVPQTQGWATRS